MTTYTEKEELLGLASDLHKDAYGMRSRGLYNEYSVEDLKEVLNKLSEIVSEQIEVEKYQEVADLVKFNELIEKTIELGASDRETAIKWIIESEELIEDYCPAETLLWRHGISVYDENGRNLEKEITSVFVKYFSEKMFANL
jgi:hypothetical protein